MIFKIGSYEFTKAIVVGSYQINQQDVYNSYTDASGVTHRNVYRQKISGSLDLYFLRSNSYYNEFVTAITGAKTTGGYYPVTLTVNNLNEDKQINAFLTAEPKRDTIGVRDTLAQFTLKVEER